MRMDEIINQTFYHVTPTKNVSHILAHGLKASLGDRSSQLENENAIYLFSSIEDAENAIMNWLGDEFDENEKLSLLEITLPKDFMLQSDVEYECFTTQNIPAKYIKVSNKLNINET